MKNTFTIISLLLFTTHASLVVAESAIENIRGIVKPVKMATISSEITGRIIQIPFRDGNSFKKNDVLVKFACDLYRAENAAANAEKEAREKNLINLRKLSELNASSNIEVDIAEAEVKKAQAQVEISRVKVRACTIKAPYSGKVINTFVNEYESISANQEILSILSSQQLEIELIVPSNWLSWLRIGNEFSFSVDETAVEYNAVVKRIGAAIDAVSQTIRVIAEFEELPENVVSGMSGTAVFKVL